MSLTNTTRIAVGVVFLLGAAVSFAGVLPLASSVSTAVGVVDLLVGLALLVSAGLESRRSVEPSAEVR